MKKNIANSVHVDDWTVELVIIAGNVPDEKQRWMVAFSLANSTG